MEHNLRPSDHASRILLVEDEAMVSEVVGKYLRRDGYSVSIASDGQEALTQFASAPYDLVVLDLMLPSVPGLEVARRLRAASDVPIIMLTARSDEVDRLVGFGVGADDYVTKPFSPKELVARVHAILARTARRTPVGAAPDLSFAELSIDAKRRLVTLHGQPVVLTAKEFDLLHYLASNAGQVFTREQLLDAVWDYTAPIDAETVTVHISRLRSKIEVDANRPRFLKTVWGIGYKFES